MAQEWLALKLEVNSKSEQISWNFRNFTNIFEKITQNLDLWGMLPYNDCFQVHSDCFSAWSWSFFLPESPQKQLIQRLLEASQIRLTWAKLELLSNNWDTLSTAPGALIILLTDWVLVCRLVSCQNVVRHDPECRKFDKLDSTVAESQGTAHTGYNGELKNSLFPVRKTHLQAALTLARRALVSF